MGSLCDGNFGIYGKKLKRQEVAEVPDDYLWIIRNAKDPPFIMINESVLDYKHCHAAKIKWPKEMRITRAVKIRYLPTGYVELYDSYTSSVPQQRFFVLSAPIRTTILECKIKRISSP